MQCVKSDQPAHREVGMILTSRLFETIGDEMRKNLNHFVAVFAHALRDSNLNVRIAALKYEKLYFTNFKKERFKSQHYLLKLKKKLKLFKN